MKLILNLVILFSFSTTVIGAEIILQNPKVNMKAPMFSAINSHGEKVKLSDFKGKPVILEWSNHECPYVLDEFSTKSYCLFIRPLLKLQARRVQLEEQIATL